MTVTPRSRMIAAAAVLVVPTLAGCSTNFSAPTDQVYDPSRGTNDRSGTVDVLGTVVVSPANGTGTAVATLVNNDSSKPDKLLAVTVAGAPAKIDQAADVTIPPLGFINLATSGAVTATADAIVAGKFIELTFTFQRGQAITIQAPVVPNTGFYADVPVKQAR